MTKLSYLLAALALVGTSFAVTLPAASATCAISVPDPCAGGDCTVNVNVVDDCTSGGTCAVNVAAQCSAASCQVNALHAINPGGTCTAGGDCDVNVQGDCKGECAVNVGVSDCDWACTINAALADCDGDCTINVVLTSCPGITCFFNTLSLVCVPPPSVTFAAQKDAPASVSASPSVVRLL